MKTIIGGKEYNLKSDNENALQMAADMVNKEIESLESRLQGESMATLSVLAALNIAERHYQSIQQYKIDNDFLRDELRKMSRQLEEKIKSA
jgi:cell division protein ZapA (FtsZ GTPase activity inhibitor)